MNSCVKQTTYWPHGAIYSYERGNEVWHAAGYNIRLQMTEWYEAVNNNQSSVLEVGCLNWGVQPNYGSTLFGLCPVTSATNDNGTLQGSKFLNGGPGYTQLLALTQTYGYCQRAPRTDPLAIT